MFIWISYINPFFQFHQQIPASLCGRHQMDLQILISTGLHGFGQSGNSDFGKNKNGAWWGVLPEGSRSGTVETASFIEVFQMLHLAVDITGITITILFKGIANEGQYRLIIWRNQNTACTLSHFCFTSVFICLWMPLLEPQRNLTRDN